MAPRDRTSLNRLREFASQLRDLLSQDDESQEISYTTDWPSLIEDWPSLQQLGDIFGLDDYSKAVLACTAASALDPGIGTLASIAHEDLSKPFISIRLLDEFGVETAFELLNPDHPLRKEGLILIGDESAATEVTAPITIESRVLNFILGIQSTENRLRSFCSPIVPNGELPRELEELGFESRSIGIVCDVSQIKRSLARSLARNEKLALEIDARNLPRRVDELDLLGVLLRREQKLADCCFVVTHISDETFDAIERLLTTSGCNFILLSADPRLLEQQLGLSDVYQLDGQNRSYQFGRLAQSIDCIATWNDIVIPINTTEKMHSVCNQIRYRDTVLNEWGFGFKLNRGKGTAVLFHGESGTGKTMAAEVIANELGRELYRVDLSTVVDKYIGETEKNLSRIFAEAEKGDCILLFDEADALFGKRSEVNDSRDRYANIEVNYLLQRLEAFDGLTILATNLRRNLDQAFLRRFKYIIEFPFPDIEMRQEIWRRSIPIATPIDEVDFAGLARISATGGTIANAVINGAFTCASRDELLSTSALLSAMRSELEKLDQPINELDFQTARMEGVA